MQRFVQIHWTQRKGYCECIFRRNCTGTGQLDSLKNVLKSPLGHNENIFTWLQMVYLWPSLLWNTHANGSFLKLFQCFNLSKCPFRTYFVDNVRYVFKYIIPGRVQPDSAQNILNLLLECHEYTFAWLQVSHRQKYISVRFILKFSWFAYSLFQDLYPPD